MKYAQDWMSKVLIKVKEGIMINLKVITRMNQKQIKKLKIKIKN